MVPGFRVFVHARNVPDQFLAFHGFLCSRNSFFHSPRTAQVMQRNLTITNGGFLWQHWLMFAGPIWVLKMIKERQQVWVLDGQRILLFLATRDPDSFSFN